MNKVYNSMVSVARKAGTLAIVLIGITAAFGLSACANKTVTGADGSTTTVTTFSTTELNANVQAGIFALNAIESIPKVQAALKASPADQQKFTDALTKLQAVSTQIATVTNGSVSFTTGKEWASAVASELQTALTVASPIVAAVYPSAQSYVDLANKLVPVVSALVSTFGQPAPAAPLEAGQYGSNLPAPAIRVRLYQGV